MHKTLLEFIESERNRFDGKHNNIFAFAFSEVGRYYDFITIIYGKHRSAVPIYLNIANQFHHSLINYHEDQKMNEERLMLLDQINQTSLIVQLEIESFYLFAKIYLDKIARAIEFYFGSAKKLSLDSHDDFVKHIEAYCKAKDLTVNEQLLSLGKKLKMEISDFRDYQIAHLKSPRTFRGTTSDGRMQLMQIYPTEKDEHKETELIDNLLSEVQEYMELIIAFITDNQEKTALRLNTTI